MVSDVRGDEDGHQLQLVPGVSVDCSPDGGRWRFSMWSDEVLRVLSTSRLSGGTLSVALHLARVMTFDGTEFVVRQGEIGKALGISRPSVSAAFQELMELGFLVRGRKVGGAMHMWRLNPQFVWKGPGEKRRAAVRELSVVRPGPAVSA